MARGATEKKEWSVPGPLRALLWWPGAAFVLVLIEPANATLYIAAAGVLLVALGFLSPMLARLLPRPTTTPPDHDDPTVEIDMPTIEIPRVHRAA
jgi:hypothetical protein